MIRRVVVFPHPEGPRRVAKAPLGTSKETSSTAVTSPKPLVRCDTRTWAASATARSEERLASGTSRSERHPAPREDREDRERDDRHGDVGDGERRGRSPVQ